MPEAALVFCDPGECPSWNPKANSACIPSLLLMPLDFSLYIFPILYCISSNLHMECQLLSSRVGQTKQSLSRPEIQGHPAASGLKSINKNEFGGNKLGENDFIT